MMPQSTVTQLRPRPASTPAENGHAHAKPDAPVDAKLVASRMNAVLDEVAKVIVGKRHILDLVAINVLAGGNILFEDYPGMAKTLLSNTFAKATGCDFGRVQFTPDVLPSDITGANVFDQKTGEFRFREGPVFTHFLLADEINRAPPKTQAALLEAMQEKQVTIEGKTWRLERPFMVMATQNPAEQEGTYPLPEAQMDRFLMKLSMGYPDRRDEAEILRRRVRRGSDDAEVRAVTNPRELVAMQNALERVHVADGLLDYVADIVCLTREHDDVYVGASPRGSQALLKACRAHAAMKGRDFVIPDDVKAIGVDALAHRLVMQPEARIRGVSPRDVVADVLQRATVPTVKAAVTKRA